VTIRVLLVDDQALIRGGFSAIINSAADMEVVEQAADGGQALRLARECLPDVVLMDIRMPGMDGLTACEQITTDPACARVKVLVLTTFEQDDYVIGAMRAGASGFLGKNAAPPQLLEAIRTVAAGDALLSPRATRAVIERLLAQPDGTRNLPDRGALDELTDRERQVVGLVAIGMSNDDIASHLVLSPLTVKTHVNRAMAKLSARDRAQLVVVAYQSGLVHPQT
jgi:DNA-binding NarL/FixJ family response regulator